MSSAVASGAALMPRLRRSRLVLGMFLLLALNSVATTMLISVQEQGWIGATANLYGFSAIIWAAFAAAIKILAEDGGYEAPSRSDVAMAIMACGAALVPHAAASKVALTLLSLHLIATTASGTPLRRAAVIFLATAGALIWGRLLLALFSKPLLDFEAGLVGGLVGAAHEGNLLWQQDGAIRLVVSPGCSAMAGLSLALLFWVTVNALYEVRFGWRALLVCLLALLATLTVNVLRMASMLRYPEHFEALHVGWGAQIATWTTLVLVAGICLFGARREIFAIR
jgi:hypothetical protein